MTTLQAAMYARVSSERPTDAQPIASQGAALHVRMAADGCELPSERQCVDEGDSGATLIRPALERLRDVIAAGGLDRLSVHSPDRLARKYAYQAVLMEEFHQAGVQVVFLNRSLDQSPEDDLLLQVQGMMAEYERGRSFWSGVGAANAMRPSKGMWGFSGRLPMAIAIYVSRTAATGPAL